SAILSPNVTRSTSQKLRSSDTFSRHTTRLSKILFHAQITKPTQIATMRILTLLLQSLTQALSVVGYGRRRHHLNLRTLRASCCMIRKREEACLRYLASRCRRRANSSQEPTTRRCAGTAAEPPRSAYATASRPLQSLPPKALVGRGSG